MATAILLAGLSITARSVLWSAPSENSIDAATIVQRMVERNRERADRLQHYTEDRHYHVLHHGFPGTLEASMDVAVTFDAPSTKQFRVISQSGSKILIAHVLKRLLDTEKEAARDPGQTALSPANYDFKLLGEEMLQGQRSFILAVEPHVESKLLYRGRIWVNAKDYAVEQIIAQPARNPSFWIEKTEIHHTYAKTGYFWLPRRNQSNTSVRVGGTAELTIDYGPYQITPAAP